MKYFLIVALLVFTSCSGVVTSRTFTQIQHGMSQEASMQKLGKADAIIEKDGMELHKYINIYGPALSHDGCGKCSTMRKSDYFVVYRNGQVVEYGQVDHRFKPDPVVTKTFFDS
ncbi:MAG: hypothetical protein NE327_03645 [Lentisphaeraceae bacterium]|nr:hypothetical protein [Lentisphaeraceae bacterium]